MVANRENPRARIAFVVYYPFQYYVYKNVYKHLADEAEFLIDPGAFFPTHQTEDVQPAIISLFEKNHVPYRIIEWSDYVNDRIDAVLAKYDALVSVWLRGCMYARKATQLKRVHMTYGVGKELTTFELHKRHYDLILAYGEYDHAFYSLITHSVIVGNPKFDDWFLNKTDDIVAISERLDGNKKTVLYLPTHSDLSSIEALSEQVKALTDTYNVIVKLHYLTSREEPWLVTTLGDPHIILLLDDSDLLPLLQYADIVVSDNSSAIFDAMLADKPIVVTNFHKPEYFQNEHWHYRFYRRGITGPLTYQNSIEQRVKRDGTVESITSPSELRPTIAHTLLRDEKREQRLKLVQTLFSYRDGSSGRRAADAIRTLRTAPSVEKPFLYYASQYLQMNVTRHLTSQATRRTRFKQFLARLKHRLRSL